MTEAQTLRLVRMTRRFIVQLLRFIDETWPDAKRTEIKIK